MRYAMLADRDIHRARINQDLIIEPWDESTLQPASVDVTLDRHFLIPDPHLTEMDMADVQPGHMSALSVDNEGIVVEPGEFLLGATREVVTLGGMLIARIEGKSSIGRLGLFVHATAGFIDPGFSGQVTLELFNAAKWDIVLYPGQRIAQLAFMRLESHPVKLYGEPGVGSHYQNQQGPVESRFGQPIPPKEPTS